MSDVHVQVNPPPVVQVTASPDGTPGPPGPPGAGVPAGGTTGQLLAKNSNADRDTLWVPAPAGGGGGGGFGGVQFVRSQDHTYTVFGSPTVHHTFRPKAYTLFDPYVAAVPDPAFHLSAPAPDDPNGFGTDISGWYLVRVNTSFRFDPAAGYPDTVYIQGCGYSADNLDLTLACSAHGGDANGDYPGIMIDHTFGPVWIPALGVDDDNSGYLYFRVAWQHAGETPLVYFTLAGGKQTLPFDIWVTLLQAT
jgi:hypothetical protein